MPLDTTLLLSFLVAIVIALYLYKDAKSRNYDASDAAILGLSLGIIGLILWVFIRPKERGNIKKMNIFAKIVLLILFVLGILLLSLSFIYETSAFASDSMKPTLGKGDLLFFTTAENLNIGDIALYEQPGTRFKIVHRIVEINPEGYIFKGDNNILPDRSIIEKENIKGKLVFSIPILGYPRLFLGI